MMSDAFYAYLHFAAILLLASGLAAEALLLRATPGRETLRVLGRADLLYGVSAGLVLVTGLARIFMGVKGAAFYLESPLFWTKVGLFALVAVVSIPPTVRILRWNRMAKADPLYAPSARELVSTRRLVMVELHLLALVPLAAVFMARGAGL
jgi:putative membrane protein